MKITLTGEEVLKYTVKDKKGSSSVIYVPIAFLETSKISLNTFITKCAKSNGVYTIVEFKKELVSWEELK